MNHSLNSNVNYLIREDFVSPELGLTFFLVFLVLVFIMHNFQSYAKTILFMNFSLRKLNDKDRLESNKNRKAGFWFTVFFLLVISLLLNSLISSISDYFQFISNISGLLISFGIVFFSYATKYLFKKYIAKIFSKEDLSILLFHQLALRDKALGIILFPLLVIYNFSLPLKATSLIFILVILSVYFVLRWINGFLIGIKHGNIPYFYSFLYICTLEIIPVVIAFKFVSKIIPSILF